MSKAPTMLARITIRAAIISAIWLIGGCGATSADNGRVTAPADAQVQIQPISEGTYYRQANSGAISITTWIEPGAAGQGWTDSQGAQDAVRAAIRANAGTLQALDYASLSLPAFVTTTRTLALNRDRIDGQSLTLEAYGTDNQGGKWAVYSWQGPEIPQLSERPLVHRWVQVYALVDLSSNRVAVLVPTVVGQVYEL